MFFFGCCFFILCSLLCLWNSLWLVEELLTLLYVFLIVRMEISHFLWELLAPLEEFESFLILPVIFRIIHISTLCEQWRPMPIAILEGGLWICKYVKNISSDSEFNFSHPTPVNNGWSPCCKDIFHCESFNWRSINCSLSWDTHGNMKLEHSSRGHSCQPFHGRGVDTHQL